MQAMFPDNPRIWHLHHIFAGTIRRSIGDRTPNAEAALALAKRVEFVITSHYPPLELISERCPLCGWGTFSSFKVTTWSLAMQTHQGYTPSCAPIAVFASPEAGSMPRRIWMDGTRCPSPILGA
jgi:hypothetical protein